MSIDKTRLDFFVHVGRRKNRTGDDLECPRCGICSMFAREFSEKICNEQGHILRPYHCDNCQLHLIVLLTPGSTQPYTETNNFGYWRKEVSVQIVGDEP